VSDESDDGEDDSSTRFLIRNGRFDCWLHINQARLVAGSVSYGDEWDASVKYTAGALVASFAIDEADATTVIADYALGGGASAFAAMHDKAGTASDLTTVGLNFAF